MDANIVFEIAKVLPREEQKKLLNMLKGNLIVKKKSKVKKKLSDTETQKFLLRTVFNVKTTSQK
ncbi:hypothetical protein LPB136_13495 [Tenacibaculum todarodis]|uniref:Uncharacterized protein n=1 Tax=Tenacibaculum todarodis TaxID=1850252 RepID=A0A1L3JML0_9FLAO|nr:hypothetical protein LPB136_13495 [Tenacibaculum todarodis]